MTDYATAIPWVTKVKGSRYGTDDSYICAAEWLFPCRDIADWGGARGHFKRWLHGQDYHLIDGTQQDALAPTTIANLANYHVQSEGILLRHVLEMSFDWATILENAVGAFQKRMVVVTFTPNVARTHIARYHLTWPCHHFNHEVDLIPRMAPYLKGMREVTARPTLPERVYFLEKP